MLLTAEIIEARRLVQERLASGRFTMRAPSRKPVYGELVGTIRQMPGTWRTSDVVARLPGVDVCTSEISRIVGRLVSAGEVEVVKPLTLPRWYRITVRRQAAAAAGPRKARYRGEWADKL